MGCILAITGSLECNSKNLYQQFLRLIEKKIEFLLRVVWAGSTGNRPGGGTSP